MNEHQLRQAATTIADATVTGVHRDKTNKRWVEEIAASLTDDAVPSRELLTIVAEAVHAVRSVKAFPHGTATGYSYKCRCQQCRTANTRARTLRYHGHNAQKLPPVVAHNKAICCQCPDLSWPRTREGGQALLAHLTRHATP